MDAVTTPKRRLGLVLRWLSLTVSVLAAAALVGAGHLLAAALAVLAQVWLGQ